MLFLVGKNILHCRRRRLPQQLLILQRQVNYGQSQGRNRHHLVGSLLPSSSFISLQSFSTNSTAMTTKTTRSDSKPAQPRIAVAISGGVDSSVAAYLLAKSYDPKEEILAIHMSNWDYYNEDYDEDSNNLGSEHRPSKCWEQDWKDAQAVARHLNVSNIVHTSFEKEYWNDVFEPYCQNLSRSITPNPDVDCNRYIKFGALRDYIMSRYNIDTLATGHYARLWDPNTVHEKHSGGYEDNISFNGVSEMPADLKLAIERDPSMERFVTSSQYPLLLAAKDISKDQSYFLSGVPGKAFRNVIFPLGELHKVPPKNNTASNKSNDANNDKDDKNDTSQLSVREIAIKAELPTAQKRDSMGICFIGKRKHGSFIDSFIDQQNISSTSKTFENQQEEHGQEKQQSTLFSCINVEDGSIVSQFDPSEQPSLLYATVGQGAKISGASQKWFVVDKKVTTVTTAAKSETDAVATSSSPSTTTTTTTLYVCPGTHHPALYADRLYVEDMNWIAGRPPPDMPILQAQCRIRHLQPLVDCEVHVRPSLSSDDEENGEHDDQNDDKMKQRYCYEIRLGKPLRGIAPGQICAIYYNDILCLGGGPITQPGPTYWEQQKELSSISDLHPSGHNDLSTTKQKLGL